MYDEACSKNAFDVGSMVNLLSVATPTKPPLKFGTKEAIDWFFENFSDLVTRELPWNWTIYNTLTAGFETEAQYLVEKPKISSDLLPWFLVVVKFDAPLPFFKKWIKDNLEIIRQYWVYKKAKELTEMEWRESKTVVGNDYIVLFLLEPILYFSVHRFAYVDYFTHWFINELNVFIYDKREADQTKWEELQEEQPPTVVSSIKITSTASAIIRMANTKSNRAVEWTHIIIHNGETNSLQTVNSHGGITPDSHGSERRWMKYIGPFLISDLN